MAVFFDIYAIFLIRIRPSRVFEKLYLMLYQCRDGRFTCFKIEMRCWWSRILQLSQHVDFEHFCQNENELLMRGMYLFPAFVFGCLRFFVLVVFCMIYILHGDNAFFYKII